MKLSPQKGGHGHITAYRAIIGSAEARSVGFIREDGTSRELEKIVDVENRTITIRLKTEQNPNEE